LISAASSLISLPVSSRHLLKSCNSRSIVLMLTFSRFQFFLWLAIYWNIPKQRSAVSGSLAANFLNFFAVTLLYYHISSSLPSLCFFFYHYWM
jgi:hypothetical protein